jgi:hypothetical protein
MSEPTREDSLKVLSELREERGHKLKMLKQSIEESMHKGYDFGMCNVSLYMRIVQIEAEARELHWVLYGTNGELGCIVLPEGAVEGHGGRSTNMPL